MKVNLGSYSMFDLQMYKPYKQQDNTYNGKKYRKNMEKSNTDIFDDVIFQNGAYLQKIFFYQKTHR